MAGRSTWITAIVLTIVRLGLAHVTVGPLLDTSDPMMEPHQIPIERFYMIVGIVLLVSIALAILIDGIRKKFNPLPRLAALALAASFIGALGFTQVEIYDRRISLQAIDRIFLLPRKEILKVMSLGHEMTVADLLWIRAVQYFGGNYTTLNREGMEYKGEGLKELFHVLEYLDPKFYQLYLFGSFAYTEGLQDYEGAIVILERGHEQFPEDWRLLSEAAFIAMYFEQDMDRALDLVERAAEVPAAPGYVKRMQGQIMSRMGRYDAAITHFARLCDSGESDLQREIACKNLYRTIRERDIFLLNQYVEQFKQDFGRQPESLDELLAEGYLLEIPQDPVSEEPYVYIKNRDEVISYNEGLERQQEILQSLQRAVNEYYENNGVYPDNIFTVVPENYLETLADPLGGEFRLQDGQVFLVPAEFLESEE